MKINYNHILKDTDDAIRQKSIKVPLPLCDEDRATLYDLLTYVRNSTDPELSEKENLRPAVGIAAPQIGVFKQLLAIVIHKEDGSAIEYALANPRIVSHSVQNAYLKSGEGCLSVEDAHEGYVYRHARVCVKGYDVLVDKEITIQASGYLSIVLQHEIDHFSGILFYDRIHKDNPWKEDPQAMIIE